MATVVDVHTHFLPLEVVDYFRSGDGPEAVKVEDRDHEAPLIVHANGLRYPVFPSFHDPGAKLEQMERDGIDISVVSIVPSLFLFELAPEETARVHRVINDAAAAYAAAGDGRIVAMATVPMNDPAAASEELRRAHDELGLHGVEVGTSMGDVMVDGPELDPVFATAEKLGVPIMLHPYASMIGDPPAGLRGFHLSNVIGNPLETCVASSRLLVGGVFDRHPDLRVLLVHAGGSFPYQLGRLDHAYDVREETKAVARRRPSAYLENLLFDTIAFDPRALEFLISVAGSSRLVFGTDSPFDMKDLGTRDNVANLPHEVQEDILGANAIGLFGLQGDAQSQAASGERSRP